MTVVTAYVDQVQKAYIAYYGRPADPIGLDFWTNKLAAVNGDWSSIIDAFGNSAEATTLLAGMNNEAKVNLLYNQILGRDADVPGLSFYVNGIANGTFTLASVAINIVNGIPAGGTDATTLANKLTSAELYTDSMTTTAQILAYKSTTVAGVRTWLSGVTTTAADQTSVNTELTAMVAAATTTTTPGQTFTLTTGSDGFTGGAGNDTFNAALSSGGQALNPGDILTGGAGTADTLNVTSTIAGNTTIAGVSLNTLEIIGVQNLDPTNTNTLTLDATNYTGVTTVQDNYSTAGVVFTNLRNIVDVAATGSGTAANSAGVFNIGYQAAAIIGTNDSATITLNSNGNAATANNYLDITENGIENVTMTTTGAQSFARLRDSALRTLTISGNKNLDLTAAGNSPFAGSATNASDSTHVQTVTATGFTGDLAIDLSGNAGNTFVSVTGGDGNDTITVNTVDKNSTIAGGAGTSDTLAVTTITSTAGTSDAFTNITGFEKVQLSGALAAATLDATAIGGVTNVVLGAAANNAGVVSNATTGFTLGYLDAAVTGGAQAVTVNITGAQVGTNDTLNVNLGTTTTLGTAARNYGTVTTTYVENVNITSNSNLGGTASPNTVNVNDLGATSIVVTGNEKLALTLAGMTTVTTLDASNANGGVAVASAVGLSTVGATITGSSAADTLYGGTGNDTIAAGGGNDTITFGNALLTNADSVDGGTGTNDTLTAAVTTALSSTTGALRIKDVENVNLTVSAASTIDATAITGASIIAVNGAANVSVTNLANGATVGLGIGATAETARATFALASATGTADSLNIKLNTTAAGQAATIVTSGIETVNISGQTGVALGAGSQALQIASVDASTVTVSGTNTTLNGRTIDLTATVVNVATTTIDASGDTDASGTFKVSANSTATTIKGSAGANSLTGGAGNDTITIGSKFNNSDTVAGGTGNDTLNATITESATVTDLSNLTAVEYINLTIDPTVATVAITTDGGLVDAAVKTIAITGTSNLTALSILGATAIGNGGAMTSFDASGFAGTTEVKFDKAALATTVTVKGGSGASDIAHIDLAATNNTGKATISGFEQIEVLSTGGAGTADLTNVSGMARLIVTDDGTARSTTINGLGAAQVVDLGYGSADLGTASGATAGTLVTASTVQLNMATITGTADAMTVNVNKLAAGGAATLNVDGVENLTMNFASAGASSWVIGEATNTNAQTLTMAGTESGNNVTLTTLPSLLTTINASGLADNLVMTTAGRSANAMTITGGTGGDTIFMENKSDSIDAGTGTDTLKIVQVGTVGGFQVDLSSGTDQVTQYNGVSNAVVQKGFESVDLSGITGSFGADITAATKAGTITGTTNADTVTLGTAADIIVMATTNAIDAISGFTHASDSIQLGGTTAAAALLVGGVAANATAHGIAFDTAAHLGANATSCGDSSTAAQVVHYAVASDTGAIYYDADGAWGAGSYQIGTLGVVTGLTIADFKTA